MTRFAAKHPLAAGLLLFGVHFAGLLIVGLGLFGHLSAVDAIAGMIVLWYWWNFGWALAVGEVLAMVRRRCGLSGRRLFVLVPVAPAQFLLHLVATVAILKAATPSASALLLSWRDVLTHGLWEAREFGTGLFLAAAGCLMGIVIGLRAAYHLERTGRWEHIEPVDRPRG